MLDLSIVCYVAREARIGCHFHFTKHLGTSIQALEVSNNQVKEAVIQSLLLNLSVCSTHTCIPWPSLKWNYQLPYGKYLLSQEVSMCFDLHQLPQNKALSELMLEFWHWYYYLQNVELPLLGSIQETKGLVQFHCACLSWESTRQGTSKLSHMSWSLTLTEIIYSAIL